MPDFARKQSVAPSRQLAFLWATTMLCVCLLLAPASAAQSSTAKNRATGEPEWNYMVRSWQSQNGLPEQTVQAFAEGRDGYLWVGTTGGLLRFDGAGFHLFNHANTPAFQEDDVFSLLATRDGTLWIGTSGGGLIEWRNGAFHALPAERGQSTAYVRAMTEDHHGRLWVATDGGLFWVKDGRLESVERQLGVTDPDAHAVLEDDAGRIWAGGSRLFAFKDGQSREYPLPGKDNRNQVKSLAESSDGVVWVGTVSGLYRLPPGAAHLEAVPGVFGLIRTLRAVAGGEMWAGTIGSGIFRIRGSRVTRLLSPSPLISDTAYSLYIDSSQNVWIGTLIGFTCLSRTPVRVLALPEAAGADFGTVALDTDNSLWLASNQLVHVVGERAVPVRFPQLGNVRVRNVLRGRDGSLWVGTIGGGVYRFRAGAVQHFTAHEGLSSNFVQALLEARDGTLWIGTNNGVSHLDRGTMHDLRTQNGLANNYIRALLEDRDGTIWIGSDHGLGAYRSGAFVSNALTAALAGESIRALYQDNASGLWIGTHGSGIYLYRNRQLAHFTTAEGLTSNTIYCILGDRRNHLWASGPSGVMLLDRAMIGATMQNPGRLIPLERYQVSEGNAAVQVLGGMQAAGALTPAGEAWFPTSQGLWRINPDDHRPQTNLGLVIDAVAVDGQTVSMADQLTVPANSNRLDIAYQPVLLSPQEGLEFRYKLEGFDRDWIYAGAWQRRATYTNLPPGKFTFVVEAWETNRPERTVRVTIGVEKLRRFYQTAWFILVCFLSAGCAVLIAYRIRMQQIRARFKAVLAERTRLAREMHDTLIQGCIGVSALLKAASSSDVDDEETRLHLIDYAATQIHTTVDEARQAVHNLRGEERALDDLPAALASMADRVVREHGLKAASTVSGKCFSIAPQATHELMMVAREAVFNAILHGRAREIRIDLSYGSDLLRMTVEDNGEGFDASEAFADGHFGLRGMRERIHQFGGKFNIESDLHKGTRVIVEIPRATLQT
ncbi:MAG: two-component regulator propeller domain-containing protein [Terracidiphilus sp.]|nr:two-component regulator propeller domain-containing protein [Terracidiphilus sp.]